MRIKCLAILLLMFSVRAQAMDWTWAGDFRFRGQAEKNGDNNTRWTEKIRLRLGVNAKIDEELRAEVRLASGTSNRSANQTIGEGFPRRYFGLDQGYFEWKPLEFSKFYAGRIPQLNHKPGGSTIILDENISLEGVGAVFDYSWDNTWRVVLAGGSVLIRENYDGFYGIANTDNSINWAQLRGEFKNERFKLISGLGFYNFVALQGKAFSDLVAGGTASGNSEGPGATVLYPFLPMQYFAEAVVPLGPVDGSVFAERIINGDAPVANKSWWLGVALAHAVWDTQIAYAEVPADVVPGLFTNGDFAGGTTNSRGWVAAVRWKFKKSMAFRVTEYIDRTQASILNKEFNKTYLDFSASF